jgi:peptidoglycan/LPS O-acetylase OafA/YrhL
VNSPSLRLWFLRHLARPQPPQEFVPQIDGLRFVAIMSVLLYHIQGFVQAKAGFDGQTANGLLQRILREGNFGVPLFFALSGYILCRPFLGGRQVSLRRYFTRRLTRLEPPYLISLALVFAAKVLVAGVAFGEMMPHLLASLVYGHNLAYGEHSTVNGVTWSLEIEWQFYLIAPVLFAIISRSSTALRHAGLLASMALGGWAYLSGVEHGGRVELSILSYFGFFAAGIWVAVMDEDHASFGRDSFAFDLLGVIAWIATITVLLGSWNLAVFLPALTALIVLCGLRGYLFRKLLGWWPIYCIGAMCYSIYLYHFFVVSAVGHLYAGLVGWGTSPDMTLLAFIVVAAPLVLLACAVPYLLVERPFMVWRPGVNRLLDAFRRTTE